MFYAPVAWIHRQCLELCLLVVFLFSSIQTGTLNVLDPGGNTAVIRMDAVEYYGYLPAAFIHHDLSFSFLKKPHIPGFSYNYWVKSHSTGRMNTRMTIGYSMIMVPGFFTGHAIARVTGAPADGFSVPYQFGIWLWTQFLVIYSLILLNRLMTMFQLPLHLRCVTVVLLPLATNLLNYMSFEPGMTHAGNFSLCAMLLYCTAFWYQNQKFRHLAGAALSLSLITLIRPTDFILLAIPLFTGLGKKKDFSERLHLWFRQRKQIVLAICLFLIPFVFQIAYWKWATGNWFYDGYAEQHFFWTRWLVPEYLFSFRKGWLLYTPVMLLAMAGLFHISLRERGYSLPIVIVLIVSIWIHSCWWSWWFGGSFGARSMIDFYPLLALPLCFCLQWIMNRNKAIRYTGAGIVLFLLHLNVFQTRQYQGGLLHWDGMTKQAYKAIFLKDNPPTGYTEMLDPADADRAMRGEMVR
ncbi:MAG: hypothetical protein JNL57_11125 [Bacteroidetes bacterium]|nr:hypothetical protein [Bacteroidota bacterium]